MTKKIELYLTVKDLAGDIVEFGVFKGAGMGLFLKLKAMYEPNSLMKVIGFDFFNIDNTLDKLDGLNKLMMSSVLNRVDNNDLSIESVNNRLSIFNNDNYKLIKGEAVLRCNEYYLENPGARIKISSPTAYIHKIVI